MRRSPLADRIVRRLLGERLNPRHKFHHFRQFSPGGLSSSMPEGVVDRSLKQAKRIEMHDRVKRLMKAYGITDVNVIMAMIQEEDERAKREAQARSLKNPRREHLRHRPERQQTHFRRPR